MLHTRRDQRENGETQTVEGDRPAPALTATKSGGQWLWVNGNQRRADGRTPDEPAPTMSFGHNAAAIGWHPVADLPATTVAADPRISARSHHEEGEQGRSPTPAAADRGGRYDGRSPIALTIEEALVLQGFPADYPVHGTKTSRFRQIGNAIPPPLAEAVLREAIGGDASV